MNCQHQQPVVFNCNCNRHVRNLDCNAHNGHKYSASKFSVNTNKSSATKSSKSAKSQNNSVKAYCDSISRISASQSNNTRATATTTTSISNVYKNPYPANCYSQFQQQQQQENLHTINGGIIHGKSRRMHQKNNKPFNQFCSQTSKSFTLPPPPPKNKGQVKTSAIRNYQVGTKRDFAVVPQGLELYEARPFDDIRISREEFEKLVSIAWESSSAAALEASQPRPRECTQLNQPKFNTLRESVKNIQHAIGNLKFLPVEMEKYVRSDPILRQRIEQAVTKKLNISSKATVYKDLVAVETPSADRVKSTEDFQKEILSLQPPPKQKDSEPNILDFNKPTFSRIKPKLPDPPPKPQRGVSSEFNDEFLLLQQEKEFTLLGERDSNASLISSTSAVNLQNLQKSSLIKAVEPVPLSTNGTSIKNLKLTNFIINGLMTDWRYDVPFPGNRRFWQKVATMAQPFFSRRTLVWDID